MSIKSLQQESRLGQVFYEQADWLRLDVESRLSRNSELRRHLTPDDVVQMVFLQAHASPKEARWPTRSQVRYWLKACAQNVMTDAGRYYRRQKREGGRRRLAVELLASTMVALIREFHADKRSPSSEVAMGEIFDKLDGAIDRLPEDRGRAIRLKYFEGMVESEIAECMGRTTSAVRALVFKGLRQLWDDRPLKKCVLA